MFPGAVLAARRRDTPVHIHAVGRHTYETGATPVGADTIYDLASLTKVLVTTAMAMILVEEGRLELEAPLVALLPELDGTALRPVTAVQLLSHSSGLPSWLPLYLDTTGKDAYLRRIAGLGLERAPGTASVYSDLGFILLGAALERAAGEPLDAFAARRLFAPLGMTRTAYRPDAALKPDTAPTEDDPWRGRLVHGEVHDENAYAMGGVAGHAGVFAPIGDVVSFALAILDGGRGLVRPETLDRFAAPCGVPGSSYGLGWDHPSGATSSAGRRFSRASIGHLGFAGTSMWIDREAGAFVILLSNSVHPRRGNRGLLEVRAAVADAVLEG